MRGKRQYCHQNMHNVLFQIRVQEIRDNGICARGVLVEVEVVRGIWM